MQQLAEALATAPVHIYGSDDGAPAGYLPAAATAAGEATVAPAQADTAQCDRDRTCVVCWEAEREVRFACGHAVCLGKGLALTLTNPNLTLTLYPNPNPNEVRFACGHAVCCRRCASSPGMGVAAACPVCKVAITGWVAAQPATEVVSNK